MAEFNQEISKNLIKKIIEDNDMNITLGKDYYEIGFCSNLGEDFYFTIEQGFSFEDFINNLKEYVYNFDYSEHAKDWIVRIDSVSGVPDDPEGLIEDAKDIDNKLNQLLEDFYKASNDYDKLPYELIDIFKTFDPYEYADSHLGNEEEVIENDIREGNVDVYINTLNDFKNSLSSEEMKNILGKDMPDRLDSAINQLNKISNGKEIKNGKQHKR